jgi:hypothetical protein
VTWEFVWQHGMDLPVQTSVACTLQDSCSNCCCRHLYLGLQCFIYVPYLQTGCDPYSQLLFPYIVPCFLSPIPPKVKVVSVVDCSLLILTFTSVISFFSDWGMCVLAFWKLPTLAPSFSFLIALPLSSLCRWLTVKNFREILRGHSYVKKCVFFTS